MQRPIQRLLPLLAHILKIPSGCRPIYISDMDSTYKIKASFLIYVSFSKRLSVQITLIQMFTKPTVKNVGVSLQAVQKVLGKAKAMSDQPSIKQSKRLTV